MPAPTNIDKYIAGFPAEIRERLEQMRHTILSTAPAAEEVISYGIPAFRWNGLLVWFAGFKNHIGFYPRVSAMIRFEKELSKYKTAKGSVQFPHSAPLPMALVVKMVKFRMKENLEVVKEKAAKSKSHSLKTRKKTRS
jgi:uncharacterized protein YdhG (YjbR/CyaY superfamily)